MDSSNRSKMKSCLGGGENDGRVIQEEEALAHPTGKFGQEASGLSWPSRRVSLMAARSSRRPASRPGDGQVPLVDDQDARLTLLDDFVGHFFVLGQDAGLGVQHENNDVATGNGFLRAFDAEKFNRVVHARRPPHAGSVNEHVFLAHALGFDFKGNIDRVARGAGNGRDDDPLRVGEGVDEGRFADVGPAHHGQLEGRLGGGFRAPGFGGGKGGQRGVHQARRSRDGEWR
jgi:hypothetical protein